MNLTSYNAFSKASSLHTLLLPIRYYQNIITHSTKFREKWVFARWRCTCHSWLCKGTLIWCWRNWILKPLYFSWMNSLLIITSMWSGSCLHLRSLLLAVRLSLNLIVSLLCQCLLFCFVLLFLPFLHESQPYLLYDLCYLYFLKDFSVDRKTILR